MKLLKQITGKRDGGAHGGAGCYHGLQGHVMFGYFFRTRPPNLTRSPLFLRATVLGKEDELSKLNLNKDSLVERIKTRRMVLTKK